MFLIEIFTHKASVINRTIKLLNIQNILFMDENTLLFCKPFYKKKCNYNMVNIVCVTNNNNNLIISELFSLEMLDELKHQKNILIISIDNKTLLYQLQYAKKINKDIDLIENLNQDYIFLKAFGDDFLKKIN